MGGLKKYMPITYWTMVIGTLALVGTPFFSGFYSKDTHHRGRRATMRTRRTTGSRPTRYWAVLLGAFVTAFYSFRLLYMTFHGKERFHDPVPDHYIAPEADSTEHEDALAHEHDAHDAMHDDGHGHDDHAHTPHESPWVVTLPLILLAIPSILIGFFTAGPMLFGTDWRGHDEDAAVLPRRDRSAAGARRAGEAGRRTFARPGRVRAARLHGAGVLAGLRRLRARDVPVPVPPGPAGEDRARCCAGRSACWSASTAWTTCGSTASPAAASRWARPRARSTRKLIDGVAVNGSARMVDLVVGRRAPRAVRLPVPLRLRDDRRPDRAAGRADPELWT